MLEITQEQAATLQSFAEQRDVLQAQITELTRERDLLQGVNKELTGTNSQLVSEIGAHKVELQEFTASVVSSVKEVSKARIAAEKELAVALVKKEVAEKELNVVLSQFSRLNEVVKAVDTEASTINGNLREAHGRVNTFLASIKEASEDIVSQSSNIKNAAENFADNVAKQHGSIAKLKSDVDKKEIMLNDRERAINELVDDYKKTLSIKK